MMRLRRTAYLVVITTYHNGVYMRSGPLILNIIIYYFLFNIISALPLYGSIWLIDHYELKQLEWFKPISFILFFGWLIGMLWMSYRAAWFSSYQDHDIEDAIKAAFNEIKMYIKLALPFLDKK